MRKAFPIRFFALFLACALVSEPTSAGVLSLRAPLLQPSNAHYRLYSQQAFLQPIILGAHRPYLYSGGRHVLRNAAAVGLAALGTYALWQNGYIPSWALWFAGLMAFHKNGHSHVRPHTPLPDEFVRALGDVRYKRLLHHARVVIVNLHRRRLSVAAAYVAPFLRMTKSQLGNMILRNGWGNYATLKAWALNQDHDDVPVIDLTKPRVSNTVDFRSDFIGVRPRGPYSRPAVEAGISPAMQALLDRSNVQENLTAIRRAFRSLLFSSQPKPIRIDTVASKIPMDIPEFVDWMKEQGVSFDDLWAWALTTLSERPPTAKMLLFGIDPTLVLQHPWVSGGTVGLSLLWNMGYGAAGLMLIIGAALIPTAQWVLDIVRRDHLVSAPVKKSLMKLCAEIKEALMQQGVPEALAQRMAGQIVKKLGPQYEGLPLWEAVGVLLFQEIEVLRSKMVVTDRHLADILLKLNPAQILAMLESVQSIDPGIAQSIVTATFSTSNPMEKVNSYIRNYQLVAAHVEQTADAKIARTIAATAYKSSDPIKRADQLLERYRNVVAHIEQTADAKIARSIAGFAFRTSNPIEKADDYLRNYQSVVAHIEKTADAEIARSIAGFVFPAEDPIERADDCLRNYQSVVAHIEKTADAEIARTIAGFTFRASNPIERADDCLRNYQSVVAHVEKTADAEIARSIAGFVFSAEDPIDKADDCLRNYQSVVAHIEKTADVEIARSIAGFVFSAENPIEKADDCLRNYQSVVAHIEKAADAKIARSIAGQTFSTSNPVKYAEQYLANYRSVVAYLETTTDREIARMIASFTLNAVDPIRQAKQYLANYRDIVAYLEKTTDHEIARSIAGFSCRSVEPIATAEQHLRHFQSVVIHVKKTPHARIARSVALHVFATRNPIAQADQYLMKMPRLSSDSTTTEESGGSFTAKMLLFGIDPTLVLQHPWVSAWAASVGLSFNAGYIAVAASLLLGGILATVYNGTSDVDPRIEKVNLFSRMGWNLSQERNALGVQINVSALLEYDQEDKVSLMINSHADWSLAVLPRGETVYQGLSFATQHSHEHHFYPEIEGDPIPVQTNPFLDHLMVQLPNGDWRWRIFVTEEAYPYIPENWKKGVEVDHPDGSTLFISVELKRLVVGVRNEGREVATKASSRDQFRLVKGAQVGNTILRSVPFFIDPTLLTQHPWLALSGIGLGVAWVAGWMIPTLILATAVLMSFIISPSQRRWRQIQELRSKGWALEVRDDMIVAWIPTDSTYHEPLFMNATRDGGWALGTHQDDRPLKSRYMQWFESSKTWELIVGAEKIPIALNSDPIDSFAYSESAEGHSHLRLFLTDDAIHNEAINKLPDSWKSFEIQRIDKPGTIRVTLEKSFSAIPGGNSFPKWGRGFSGRTFKIIDGGNAAPRNSSSQQAVSLLRAA